MEAVKAKKKAKLRNVARNLHLVFEGIQRDKDHQINEYRNSENLSKGFLSLHRK